MLQETLITIWTCIELHGHGTGYPSCPIKLVIPLHVPTPLDTPMTLYNCMKAYLRFKGAQETNLATLGAQHLTRVR